MEKEKMFELATRNKVRFPYKGMVSVEDLWDIPVRGLDSIFKALNAQIKQAQEESLLDTKTKEDKALELQIELVKYIVNVKLDEEAKRLKRNEVKKQKEKIMEIMATKQDEALQSKSLEELSKIVEELGE